RRRMNDYANVRAEFPEDFLHRRLVADIDGKMAVAGEVFFQPGARLRSGRLGAEKFGPHIVVDADELEAFARERTAGCGADQAGRSSDQGEAHRNRLRRRDSVKTEMDMRVVGTQAAECRNKVRACQTRNLCGPVELDYGNSKMRLPVRRSL